MVIIFDLCHKKRYCLIDNYLMTIVQKLKFVYFSSPAILGGLKKVIPCPNLTLMFS